jgi:hypothetical protein
LARSAYPRNSDGSPPAANGGICYNEFLQLMSGKGLIAVRESGRMRPTRKAAGANSQVIGHRATGVGTDVSYNVSRTRRHEMLANRLPHEIDTDKLAEAALAILSLTLHDEGRVWKGLDWDLMDLLHEKGWIVDPQTKAKSVVLTEDGERLATEFLRKHFGRRAA